MKYVKISCAVLLSTIILGCSFAYAKSIPTAPERLVAFNEQLIKDYQEQWAEADEYQKHYEAYVEEYVTKKIRIEELADMARLNIAVLKGEPTGVDFTMPVN